MRALSGMIIALCVAQVASAELTDGLYAAFETSMGSFTCRLDYAEAPLTCANFVGLAEGQQRWVSPEGAIMSEPFYDGLLFHRVIDGFMIQGGDPLGTGAGGPGYALHDQISPNLTHHSGGVLSMANSGPDSNGSQFFITLAATAWLDGKHAVFGEVIAGMDIVSDIGSTAVTNGSVPLTSVVIHGVEILRIGSEAVAFDPANQPLPQVSSLSVMLSNTVSVATSNQCEQFIYCSTNLIDWANAAGSYTFNKGDDLSVSIPANQSSGFYRAAQIFYPETVATFSDIAGRSLTFIQGESVLTFSPLADGQGSCNILGNSDGLDGWADWTSGPFPGIVFFEPVTYPPFYFTLSVDGSCKGYQWNGFQWNSVGSFELSMTFPAP